MSGYKGKAYEKSYEKSYKKEDINGLKQKGLNEKIKKQTLIIFGLCASVIFVCFLLFNFALFPTKYKNYVTFYSDKYGLDKALVYAVIKTESGFDSGAISPSNARGLMQVIESTGRWIASELDEEFEVNNLFDPETNIRYGCFYLSYLFEKFADIDIVICAYNAGETAVRNWLDEDGKLDYDKVTYSETKNYYKKVKGYYNVYKNHKIFI